MIPDYDRGRCGEISLSEIGNRFVPAFLAGLGIERDEIIVRRLHEQVAVPHSEAAIADMSAALGVPEVVPQFAAVASIHGPGIVGHGEVENPIHLERGGFDAAASHINVARSLAADDDGSA